MISIQFVERIVEDVLLVRVRDCRNSYFELNRSVRVVLQNIIYVSKLNFKIKRKCVSSKCSLKQNINIYVVMTH